MKKVLIGLVAALLLMLAGAGAAYAVTNLGPGQPPQINQTTVCQHIPYTDYNGCHREVTVKPVDNWAVVVHVGKWRCDTYRQDGVRHTFCEKQK